MMKNRLYILILLSIIALTITGCPPLRISTPMPPPTNAVSTTEVAIPTESDVESPTSTSAPVIEEVSITIRGVGLASETEPDPSIRRRSAIRSAELAADLNYAEWVSGVQLEAVTVRQNSTITEDKIREAISKTVQLPCQIMEENYDDEIREAEIFMECIVRVEP